MRLLLQGSAHAIPLRDESVQEVVTSPPYWGLRAYAGEQSFVWGGDPEHEHEWTSAGSGEGYTGTARWQHSSNGCGEEQPTEKRLRDPVSRSVRPEAWAQIEQGASCSCGAWYGALGLEPTLELYVEHMVAIFREVRRVLRPDGTVWLNLGDSYNAGTTVARRPSKTAEHGYYTSDDITRRVDAPGLEPKNLLLMPHRIGLALQADGWIVRSDVIWSKSNPMPESATDRPTMAHEHIFLLTKSGSPMFWTHRDHAGTRSRPKPDYRWLDNKTGDEHDAEPPNGWREETFIDLTGEEHDRWKRINLWSGHDYFYDQDAIREQGTSGPSDIKKMTEGKDRLGGKTLTDDEPLHAANASTNIGQKRGVGTPGSRNARTVWEIATAPYAGAHFATFPEKLAERCVLAGSSRQACAECGAPWARVTEHEYVKSPKHGAGSIIGSRGTEADDTHLTGGRANKEGLHGQPRVNKEVTTLGWKPTCEHDDGSGRSVVFDPFAGTSTVGRAALRLGRNYVGLDISREYLVDHSVERLRGVVTAVQEVMPLEEAAS